MTTSRRTLLHIALANAAVGLPLVGRAQVIDNAKILSGFAPGGTLDTLARRVGQHMNGGYAKAVVVDTRSGAGGQIAISSLKTSLPDGSVLLATPMSMLGIYPHTYKRLPYDPLVDLTPVSLGVVYDMGFAVGPQVRWTMARALMLVAMLRRCVSLPCV